MKKDDKLCEQNFGDSEGVLFTKLPNLGSLINIEIADLKTPNGESNLAMCKRASVAIIDILKKTLDESLLVICHAGHIRVAISLAMQNIEDSLKFEINNLSLTRLRV